MCMDILLLLLCVWIYYYYYYVYGYIVKCSGFTVRFTATVVANSKNKQAKERTVKRYIDMAVCSGLIKVLETHKGKVKKRSMQ